MSERKKLLLAFYGDDFTGSTDALEFLSRAGARTRLFMEPPDPEQLDQYGHLDAIGVAGMTRALPPSEMETVLEPAFKKMFSLGADHVHYKVCSTFDSSPHTGSIGKAIETGARIFPHRYIPLLVAAPPLGRYSAFGNLFARMGIGTEGSIYRLDRHPSMSKHPVTPAAESDLRTHLSHQTTKTTGLLDILTIIQPIEKIQKAIDVLVKDGSEIILFDALYEEQLLTIGELLQKEAKNFHPLFSAGSSGIEMALGKSWREKKVLQPAGQWPALEPVKPLLVLSGSCSPVTTRQISRAIQRGFKEVKLDVEQVLERPADLGITEELMARLVTHLENGEHVIVHTSGELVMPRHENAPSSILGTALGAIARKLAAQVPIKRVVVAGGDTSSYVARAMGIESVEMITSVIQGAPVCKAHAPGSSIDGLEVNFKGGQVGDENYFELLTGQERIPYASHPAP